MRVEELRIGNLLRDKFSKTELKVIELTEENIITYVIDRSMFPLKDGWGIEPIPLTEEWLLKFGFEAQEESFHLKDFSIELIGDDGRWCAYIYDEYHAIECPLSLIKHVHQLQNLYFALTGEELTLKA